MVIKVQVEGEGGDQAKEFFQVECQECKTRGPSDKDQWYAISHWNCRDVYLLRSPLASDIPEKIVIERIRPESELGSSSAATKDSR